MEQIIDLNFYKYLDYNDYIKLILCNKTLYNYYISINNDSFYRHLLIIKFSDKFANNVYPIINSYKLSFLSINKFETILKKNNYNTFTEKEYYLIWSIKYNYCVSEK